MKQQLTKKYLNDEIFWNYFKYQNPPFFAKEITRANRAKTEQLVINVNNGLIDLRNNIIK